jgi:GH25 family lysozyme M1 (1,4-beta-N-acetylmuramidase)
VRTTPRVILGLVVLTAACAAHTPGAPTPIAVPAPVPASLTLTSVSGIGASAGQVFVDATVLDAAGKGIGGSVVHFSTTAGTFPADNITADGGGLAQATVNTTATATITATTGPVSGQLTVVPNAR